MKPERPITASELAECCLCEQRVWFKHTSGRRDVSTASRPGVFAGVAAHAEMHRRARIRLEGRQCETFSRVPARPPAGEVWWKVLVVWLAIFANTSLRFVRSALARVHAGRRGEGLRS